MGGHEGEEGIPRRSSRAEALNIIMLSKIVICLLWEGCKDKQRAVRLLLPCGLFQGPLQTHCIGAAATRRHSRVLSWVENQVCFGNWKWSLSWKGNETGCRGIV